jgi:TonB-linked SusC/RagA family outer membrane protein
MARCHRRYIAAAIAAIGILSIAPRGRAQEGGSGQLFDHPIQLADRGPVFYRVDREGERVDVRNAAVLQRRIALDLRGVLVAEALDTIAKRSGLALVYQSSLIPSTARVTLAASDISVAAVLTVVLLDAGLDVQLTGSTRAALMPRAGGLRTVSGHQPGTVTISGHVIDGVLRTTLPQVSVRVDGTALSAVSSGDGKYSIAGVAPGTYHVTARRVGYQPLTRDVTVTADQQATLDFALVAAPTKLDEVVTTAVGQQRRYEVGNTISTINADSIAPTAPITSLTDLISARAPGVTVLETSGMTGAGEAIRIRGLSSLVLQGDPILIVDGVRQDNSAGGDLGSIITRSLGDHPTPTRLNDLDFNDIATIDILKGPSASTEYGTDAANGVIVITTKHGTAGRPQWKVSAEQTESGIPETFANGYYSWGHLTDGSNAAVNCPVLQFGGGYAQYGAPYNTESALGTCITDSVTQWNPLNHAATTIFGTGDRSKYDLSVSGGSEAVRYFISGGLSNETGVIRMPPVFQELADTAGLGLPSSALNANSEQQRSVRVNTAIKLGSTADLSATGSYLSTYQQTPNAGDLYLGAFSGPALSDAAHYYGYGGFGSAVTPVSELSEIGSQNTDRVTGGLTANWRPAGWFLGHATVGLDHGSQGNEELNYPLANAAYDDNTPGIILANATTDVYSVDVRGTATASLLRGVRAVTSGGVQMVDTRLVGQSAYATGITATNLTLNGATGPIVAQQATRQATLGGYGEEEVSFADRLFLTGALRIDAGSGFGRAFATAAYPKASVSWLAINQGPTTVRVRGAFGESGLQPTNGAALQLYAPTVSYLGGTTVPANSLSWPGNPNLQPERSAELEGGVDAGWGNRVSLELTAYAKTTHDALVDVNLGGTLGNYAYEENIGEVRNTGVEGSVTVGVVQTRSITWDVAVNASVNHNTLLSLAPGVVAQTVQEYPGSERQTPGYPLYGLWAQQVTYADANHDGIIEPNEVTIADSASYMGPSLPTQEVSVSTHVGLWRGAVTVGGLVDYRGGYKIANAEAYYANGFANNEIAQNDPTAPLWLQARVGPNNSARATNSLDVEDGAFVRVREVSVTYALPRGAVRALRMQSLSVTGAVRNLALWTRYSGSDPEVSNTAGNGVQLSPLSNGYVLNNNVREDFGTVPLARYWVVRLNVGL